MSIEKLKSLGIESSKQVELNFASGIKVRGKLINIVKNVKGENILMSFDDCTVVYNDEVLFLPDWGMYDMAVGHKITSVFSGAADREVYLKDNPFVPGEKTHKINYSEQRKSLHKLYQKVRDIRNGDLPNVTIYPIWAELKKHKDDWLCAIELLEICEDNILSSEIIDFLKSKNDKSIQHLVDEGLSLVI
jgi:phenylalanine-4-hydroxylase